MKKKSSRKITIFGAWTLAFIITASILAGVASGEQFKLYELRIVGDDFKSGEDNSEGNVDVSTTTSTFNCDELQKTQDGKDFCGNVVNSQIYCKVKQTTEIVDGEGNVVGTKESPFFAGNPVTTFELTDKPSETDITEGGFLITAKMKCASDANAITSDIFEGNLNPFIQPSVDIPLKIKEGSLLVKVFSKDSKGVEHETFNGNLNFGELILTDPKEKNLGDITIGSDRLLVYIPSGQYDSQQRIDVTGNIDIVWRDFPSVNYRLTLEEGDIPTFREISVVKSQPPEEIECAEGEVKQGNVCVKQDTGDETKDPPTVTTLNGLQEAILCIENGNYSCLLQDKFIPYIVAGIGGLFLIGAITHNSAPKFNAMGYPMR